jgi:hypothetical protein
MRLFAILFVSLLVSCKSEKNTEARDTLSMSESPAEPVIFITHVEDLRLREGPGEKAAIITTLEKGTMLRDAGEVSDYTSKVKLRGITYDEPWIKVITVKGEEGWVYAGGLEIKEAGDEKMVNALVQKKSTAIFGQTLTQAMNQYRNRLLMVDTAEDLAAVMTEGMTIRDDLSKKLLQYATPGPDADYLDISWLPRIFPGFLPLLTDEGTRYYVFMDYKAWGKIARKTSGIQDDLYLDIQYLAHSTDSIEYIYPAWEIWTSSVNGYSMLGSGIHQQILDKISAQYDRNNPFGALLMQSKTAVIANITDSKNQFWLPLREIQQELDAILSANYRMLSKEERVSLETRRKQLDNADAFGILTNARAGE